MKIIDKKILNLAKRKASNSNKEKLIDFLFSIIHDKALTLSPAESLQFLFELENKIYRLEGQESIRYGNGIHTKHKHIKYHDYFINNIPKGSRVLDIGCGNGALTADIAERVTGVFVYGIDIVSANIEKAKQTFNKENIKYICGDALIDLPDEKFDIIVLSNMLEHIEKRIEFLKSLKKRYQPSSFIIRIPIFERDWRVPLKKELGIDYRLDSTHYVEYLQEEFFEEIKQAGLKVTNHQIKWGEIWAETR